MITYAIMIENRYFKDYIYATKKTVDRYAGNTQLGSVITEGDIIGIITTDKPERTEVRRSVANTIAVLYDIENLKNKIIEIIPTGRG